MFDTELSWFFNLAFYDVLTNNLSTKRLMTSHLKQELFSFVSYSCIIISKSVEKVIKD